MIDFQNWIIPFTFIPGVGMLVLSTSNRLHYLSVLIRQIVADDNHIDRDHLDKFILRTRYYHKNSTFTYGIRGFKRYLRLSLLD